MENWDYVNGTLRARGIDPWTFRRGDLLDAALALAVDGVTGWVDRGEILDKIRDALENTRHSGVPDKETWGTSREAQRALQAVMRGVRRPQPPAAGDVQVGPVLIEDPDDS